MMNKGTLYLIFGALTFGLLLNSFLLLVKKKEP